MTKKGTFLALSKIQNLSFGWVPTNSHSIDTIALYALKMVKTVMPRANLLKNTKICQSQNFERTGLHGIYRQCLLKV